MAAAAPTPALMQKRTSFIMPSSSSIMLWNWKMACSLGAARSAMDSSSSCAVRMASVSSCSSRDGLKGPTVVVSTWCSNRLT